MTRKLAFLLLIAVYPGLYSGPALADALATPPHAEVGSAEYPDADCVILRHEQEWTLNDDGSIRVLDHKWLKMLSPRAIWDVADPRIDYREGSEKVNILIARTFTPDGKVVDVPDYGRNLVSPGGSADWPAFADLRQQVVSFSGVQPDAIYELAFERVIEPGAQRWLWADLRLQEEYPTIEREVTVAVPTGTEVSNRIDHSTGQTKCSQGVTGDKRTYHWSFKDLAACEDEAHSPRWQERCGRLRFTTCPSASAWTEALVKMVGESAAPAENVKKFADDAVGDELDGLSKIRKICEKLKATMNDVDAASTWADYRCRPAPEVLASSYQNAPEAAALCMAALRAVGFEPSPAIAVHASTWNDEVPIDSMAEAFILSVPLSDGLVWVHPTEGIINGTGRWYRYRAISISDDGRLQSAELGAERPDLSQLAARLSLKIDGEGKVSGRLNVALTGYFVDAESLRTDEQKESKVKSVMQHVLPGFEVRDVSVSALSDYEFRADAAVEGKDVLKDIGELRGLALSADFPFTEAVALPLDLPDRRTPVQLATPFNEEIELVIEYPEAWNAVIVPASFDPPLPTFGRAGLIKQAVEASNHSVRIRRQVRLGKDEIAPNDFGSVRDALNTLRTEACRRIAFRPKPGASPETQPES